MNERLFLVNEHIFASELNHGEPKSFHFIIIKFYQIIIITISKNSEKRLTKKNQNMRNYIRNIDFFFFLKKKQRYKK